MIISVKDYYLMHLTSFILSIFTCVILFGIAVHKENTLIAGKELFIEIPLAVLMLFYSFVRFIDFSHITAERNRDNNKTSDEKLARRFQKC